jgi:signal transduction histidine kinase
VLSIETRNPAPRPSPETRRTLEITFADNGVGIPEAQLPYLFEPFFTTKAPGKGTGLGLSVCYMIVKASGGSIRVHSREGDGTRMVIELPLFNGGDTSNVG